MKIHIQLLKKIKLASLLLDISWLTFMILDSNSGSFLNFLIKAAMITSSLILHSIFEKYSLENFILFKKENTVFKIALIVYAIILFILK